MVVDRHWNMLRANNGAVRLVEFLVGPLAPRLRDYEGVREAMTKASPPASAPVLPMHFRKGDTTLRLFTTVATLGTPQDITLQELGIESFFPMDSDTTNVLRTWALGERATKA